MVDAGRIHEMLDESSARLQAGRLQEAETICRKALILAPENARAHHMMGAVEIKGGRRDVAIEHFRKAVQLRPNDAMYHNTLGAMCAEARQPARAIHHFWQALMHEPQQLNALQNLGQILLDMDDLFESQRVLERGLRISPEAVELNFLMGRVLLGQERAAESIEWLQRTLEREPQHVEAMIELGSAVEQGGSHQEAADHCREAIQLKPDFAEAHRRLANVLQEMGSIVAAIECYERAIELEPRALPVLRNLGVLYAQSGDSQRATECLRKMLEYAPNSPEALFLLSQSDNFSPDEATVQHLAELAETTSIPEPQRIRLHFALGKICEDGGGYAQAFAHYRQANSLKRAMTLYDRRATTARVDSLIQFFDEQRFQTLAGRMAADSELPSFVLGMPRSGTTLVEQILASHPDIHGAGELNEVEQLPVKLVGLVSPKVPFPNCLETLDAEVTRQLAEAHVETLREMAPDAKRVVDKMPANFFLMGLIALMWPKASVIHCRRDAMDVCLSCYTRHFANGQRYSWELADLGHYYREYERLTEHWRKVLPIRVYEVQYERLVEHQSDVTRELIEFCGLDWDDRCLKFHETQRRIKTNPYAVRRPVYTNSIGRWRRFEQYVQPLQDALSGQRTAFTIKGRS